MNPIGRLKLKIGEETVSVLYSVFGGLVLIAFWLYISQTNPVDQPPPVNTSIVKDMAFVDDENYEGEGIKPDDDSNEHALNRLPRRVNSARNQNVTASVPAFPGTTNPSTTSTAQQPTPAATITKTTPGSYKDGTYSATSGTPWGDLTVSVTVTNGKWSKVDPVQIPDSPPSIYAVSRLAQQALNVQNQNINGVSGATYVSNAFHDDLSQIIQQSKN